MEESCINKLNLLAELPEILKQLRTRQRVFDAIEHQGDFDLDQFERIISESPEKTTWAELFRRVYPNPFSSVGVLAELARAGSSDSPSSVQDLTINGDVRVFPGDLTCGLSIVLKTKNDDERSFLVVCGDLQARTVEVDYGSILVVTGDLNAKAIRASGDILVFGNLAVETAMIGEGNDYCTVAGGTLACRLVFAPDYTAMGYGDERIVYNFDVNVEEWDVATEQLLQILGEVVEVPEDEDDPPELRADAFAKIASGEIEI